MTLSGVLIFVGIASFIVSLFSSAWFVLTVICCGALLFVWPSESDKLEESLRLWNEMRMCTRCGHFYTLEVGSSHERASGSDHG